LQSDNNIWKLEFLNDELYCDEKKLISLKKKLKSKEQKKQSDKNIWKLEFLNDELYCDENN